MRFTFKLLGTTACTLLLAGCFSNYYMVRDPGSGTAYYTTDVKKAGSAVQFKDARTGAAVTLQNSEVKEISKDEFAKASKTPTPAPPAPAAPAVAAPAAAAPAAPAPGAPAEPASAAPSAVPAAPPTPPAQ